MRPKTKPTSLLPILRIRSCPSPLPRLNLSLPPAPCAADGKPSATSIFLSHAPWTRQAKRRGRRRRTHSEIPGNRPNPRHGENKVSVLLGSDFRSMSACSRKKTSAPRCCIHRSKSHNVALRGRALDMGWTLNEYALTTLKAARWSPASPKKKSTPSSASIISSLNSAK